MLRFALPCLDDPAATDRGRVRDGGPELDANRLARSAPRPRARFEAPRRHEARPSDDAARDCGDFARIADGACPICACDLEFHQPDEEFPERLLAICPFCRAWFVVQGGECVEIPLPR